MAIRLFNFRVFEASEDSFVKNKFRHWERMRFGRLKLKLSFISCTRKKSKAGRKLKWFRMFKKEVHKVDEAPDHSELDERRIS